MAINISPMLINMNLLFIYFYLDEYKYIDTTSTSDSLETCINHKMSLNNHK